jgi:hypothetical protein
VTGQPDNLTFTLRPIEAVPIRPNGAGVIIAQPIIQRLAALRAYSEFATGKDWMEKLSSAFTVALATRSADTYVMQTIQNAIVQEPPIQCAKCREATFGLGVIRTKLFPKLAVLREHANDLLHHLDDPENRGVNTLNIQGVFKYCYHLFQENAGLLFGEFPDAQFELRLCKQHRSAGSKK